MQNKSIFEKLPKDTIFIILSLLPAKDLSRLALVNKLFKILSLDDSLWKSQCQQINVPSWDRFFCAGNFKTCYLEHKGFHTTRQYQIYYVVGGLIENTAYSFSTFRRYKRKDISVQEIENSFPKTQNKIEVFRNLDHAKYYAKQKNDIRYMVPRESSKSTTFIEASIAPVFVITIDSGLTVKERKIILRGSNMEVTYFELLPSHIEKIIKAYFKNLTIRISQNYKDTYSCVLV